MSTLVLVLAAGMTIPGDVPKEVSWEVEQGLDLRGQWEGVWYWPCGMNDNMTLCRGTLTLGACGPLRTSNIVDEGGGLCRLSAHGWVMPGIYQQQSDRVIICFRRMYSREDKDKRPTSFQRTSEQHLLILHRVKPAK
jgi:hypothetical protein